MSGEGFGRAGRHRRPLGRRLWMRTVAVVEAVAEAVVEVEVILTVRSVCECEVLTEEVLDEEVLKCALK